VANNPTGPLVISGDIARGDYERLLSKIADDENRILSQNKIIVASTARSAGLSRRSTISACAGQSVLAIRSGRSESQI